jgi:hypothetical protein
MLRRLFTSALIFGGTIVLSAPSTHAQSVLMPFSGTISNQCAFNTASVVAGTLAPSPVTNPTTLASTGSGGGSVSLNCLGPVNITLSAPIQTSGPTFTPTACQTSLSGGTDINYSSCTGTSPASTISATASPLSILMSVSNPAGIPAGAYNYKVTLSIVP